MLQISYSGAEKKPSGHGHGGHGHSHGGGGDSASNMNMRGQCHLSVSAKVVSTEVAAI